MSRYIDADALRHLVLYFADASNLNGNHEQAKAYNHCLGIIDERKTADVRENVHGEWIFIPIDDSRGRRTGDMRCVCTKCTYEIVLPFSKNPYNYCPNCGADMRKGE